MATRLIDAPRCCGREMWCKLARTAVETPPGRPRRLLALWLYRCRVCRRGRFVSAAIPP